MIVACYALANICTGHSELETLTVALAAARAFASAPFPMLLHCTILIVFIHQLLDECLWVALHYLGLGRLYHCLLPRQIVAILAPALAGVAVIAPCETLTVELEALRSTALALSRQSHRLQHYRFRWFVVFSDSVRAF